MVNKTAIPSTMKLMFDNSLKATYENFIENHVPSIPRTIRRVRSRRGVNLNLDFMLPRWSITLRYGAVASELN
ncbi:MAG: hypothetical protein ABJG41_00030 [Cyclobacteriaceae bacterium]